MAYVRTNHPQTSPRKTSAPLSTIKQKARQLMQDKPFLCMMGLLVFSFAFDVQAAGAGDPFAAKINQMIGWMTGAWSKMIVIAVGVGGMMISGFKGQLGGIFTSLGIFVFGITFFDVMKDKFAVSFEDLPVTQQPIQKVSSRVPAVIEEIEVQPLGQRASKRV